MISHLSVIFLIIFFIFSSDPVYAQHPLHAGETAPSFKGTDRFGNEIFLDSLLKKGSVIMLFYRGGWCPYCVKQLKELGDSLNLITEKGASVIAVTCENEELIKQTAEKTNSGFDIIHDKDYKIMRDYKVAFKLNRVALKKYKDRGIDIEKVTGDNAHILPVPAMYIINPKGIITYVFFNTDYTQRPPVKTILANL